MDMQDTDAVKKQYILHYILKPDLASDEELHGQRTAINLKVEAAGGKVDASVCQDNARRLAYPIKKADHGYFCEIVFQLEPGCVQGLYENLRLERSILRYTIEAKRPAEKNMFRRKSRSQIQSKIEVPPVKSDLPTEKMSVEELDKKLDEIIKNI